MSPPSLAERHPRAAVVREHRRLPQHRVALAQLELAAEQRLAAGGVEGHLGVDVLLAAVGVAHAHAGGALAVEAHGEHLDAFADLGALRRGVLQQQVVELGAAHLERLRRRLAAEGAGEADVVAAAVGLEGEVRTPLALEAGGGELVPDAEAAQQRLAARQQRLADVETGEALAVVDAHAQAPAREQRADGASRRAAADDDGVEVGHGRAGG